MSTASSQSTSATPSVPVKTGQPRRLWVGGLLLVSIGIGTSQYLPSGWLTELRNASAALAGSDSAQDQNNRNTPPLNSSVPQNQTGSVSIASSPQSDADDASKSGSAPVAQNKASVLANQRESASGIDTLPDNQANSATSGVGVAQPAVQKPAITSGQQQQSGVNEADDGNKEIAPEIASAQFPLGQSGDESVDDAARLGVNAEDGDENGVTGGSAPDTDNIFAGNINDLIKQSFPQFSDSVGQSGGSGDATPDRSLQDPVSGERSQGDFLVGSDDADWLIAEIEVPEVDPDTVFDESDDLSNSFPPADDAQDELPASPELALLDDDIAETGEKGGVADDGAVDVPTVKVMEPSSFSIFGIGLLGLVCALRRRSA